MPQSISSNIKIILPKIHIITAEKTTKLRYYNGMINKGYTGRKILISVAVLLLFAAGVTLISCSGFENSVSVDKHVVINCTFDYLVKGESRRYFAKINPAQAGYEIVWKSENEDVATVDERGVVTAVSAGETQISAEAKNTPYKAKLKLTVADKIVEEKDGADALQKAVDELKNNGWVLVIGGYYPTLNISGHFTVTGAEGAGIGDIKLEKDSALFLYSTGVYAVADSEGKACVEMDENSEFTAVNCAFSYIDPTEEKMSDHAVFAPSDASRIYLRACSFSGYKTCLKTGATDGEIYVVNNDFSRADTAVEVDLRIEGTTLDKNASGRIGDNVYIACGECVKLYYNAQSYTGSLEISDADVSVPK